MHTLGLMCLQLEPLPSSPDPNLLTPIIVVVVVVAFIVFVVVVVVVVAKLSSELGVVDNGVM